MSGWIENFIEPKVQGWLVRIYPKLGEPGELRLAGGHFWHMAAIALFCDFIGALYGWGGYAAALCAVSLVIIAEWPPKGRVIDVITRGAGWLIGAGLAIWQLL